MAISVSALLLDHIPSFDGEDQMIELKVDAERVRKTADSCPDARRALETLFPEAFVKPASSKEVCLKKSDYLDVVLQDDNSQQFAKLVMGLSTRERNLLWLSHDYHWEVITIDSNLYLRATRK